MKAKMILRRFLVCLSVLCPISAWGGSTAVWPSGSWLVPPGWSAPGDSLPLSYGKAYFTPVLLPANASVTKLGIVQAGPANNAAQLIRLCLYSSNANGMPGTLLKDGGETAIAMSTPDYVNDVVNFAPVPTGSTAIFSVDVQLKQPTSASFAAELFTSRAGFSAGPLPSQIIGITNGSTYSSPMPYGRCPAVAPAQLTLATDHRGPCPPICFNGTVTLAVGIGH
jgi:hypothetical protein